MGFNPVGQGGGISLGSNVSDALQRIGVADQAAALIGANIDSQRGDIRGVARNLLDAFTPLSERKIDKLLTGGFAQPGFAERPHVNFPHNFACFSHTHYTKEKMFPGNFLQQAIQGPAAERQLFQPGNEALRAAFEAKLGGRLVCDGKFDGNITVARQVHHPLLPFQNHVQRNIGSILQRCFQPPKLNDVLQNLGNFLKEFGGMKFPTNFGGINIGNINIGGINIGGGPGGPGGPSGPGGSTGPGGSSGAGGGSSVGDPGEILKNPNLSFEEKIFLFMLAFCEKKQKEIEKKMADMEAKQKAGQGGGDGGGGKKGGIGGMLGGLGQAAGGLFGGAVGGPFGSMLGSQIGGMAGGMASNLVGGAGGGGDQGAGGAGAAGGGKGSEQTDQAILQNEMQKLQKMFEGVNNVLKIISDMAMSSIQKMKLQG